MKKCDLSAIIIAKNEETKIEGCLRSLTWIKEIIVVDTGSIDKTKEIAKKFTKKVYSQKLGGFDTWRNFGAKKASFPWLLYVDCDERVTPELRLEIEKEIEKNSFSIYAIPRKNIILGKFLKHGGWWPDYVKRLIKKEKLIKWVGRLHEEPVFLGEIGYLKNPFIHLKHDNLEEMVEKTNKWSEIEAELLLKAKHPKMQSWRFFRIMFSESFYRLFILKGILDGTYGIIYSLYQMWSRFLTYGKLYESCNL